MTKNKMSKMVAIETTIAVKSVCALSAAMIMCMVNVPLMRKSE